MNLKQLREEAWARAREISNSDSTRLWTKAEMNGYINRVYRYIAKETRCIRDAITPSLCQITVAPPVDLATVTTLAVTDVRYQQDLLWYQNPNSWLYILPQQPGETLVQYQVREQAAMVAPYLIPLDPLILEVDEAKWTNKAWRLSKVSVTKWQLNVFWETTRGMPIEYATDLQSKYLALNYRAQDSDILRLSVKRMPLADLVLDTDIPEFRDDYHDYFIHGILMHMYSKQDAQCFDGEKKATYEAKFAADVDDLKQLEMTLNQRLNPNQSVDAFR